MIFGAVLFSLSIISLLISVFFFILYLTFERKKERLGKATAVLKQIKHKKNVPIYGRNVNRAPLRVMKIIKNQSKGVYEYTVGDKKHKIRYTEHVTANQLPRTAQVVYLKRLPAIAYVNTDTGFHNFDIYSLVALIFSVMFALWGASVIF